MKYGNSALNRDKRVNAISRELLLSFGTCNAKLQKIRYNNKEKTPRLVIIEFRIRVRAVVCAETVVLTVQRKHINIRSMPDSICEVCAKPFYAKPSHRKLGWGKFCSIKCRSHAQRIGKHIECFVCRKKVYRSPRMMVRSKSGKYFCSKSCQTQWRNSLYVGERSINWVNGKRAYRNILLRSNRTPICLLCRMNDLRVLSVHHRDHRRSHNTVDNLIWLCFNCHYLVHHDKKLDEKIRVSVT